METEDMRVPYQKLRVGQVCLNDALNDIGSGASLGKWENVYPASKLPYHCSFWQSVGLIISALDMYCRPRAAQELDRSVLIKNADEIHASKMCDHLSTLALGHKRPQRALEPLYGFVAVYAHHEDIAKCAGLCEVTSMTYMEKVEAAICEDDPTVRCA